MCFSQRRHVVHSRDRRKTQRVCVRGSSQTIRICSRHASSKGSISHLRLSQTILSLIPNSRSPCFLVRCCSRLGHNLLVLRYSFTHTSQQHKLRFLSFGAFFATMSSPTSSQGTAGGAPSSPHQDRLISKNQPSITATIIKHD